METESLTKNELFACLPFIELAHETPLHFGPVSFWAASRFSEWIEEEDQENFKAYIQSIGQIKTRTCEETHGFIQTATLSPEGTTCVSISIDVPPHLREQLIVDAVYSLYFTCNFRNLYYGTEVFPFNVFKKLIPASKEFIHNKQSWELLHIDERHREQTICIHLFDSEMSNALGRALSGIYQSQESDHPERIDKYRRLIRSIRYSVDRFFERFVNLFDTEIQFGQDLFQPEEIIFLSSSFESLFNIDEINSRADFKHKLRPLLHLKYSTPVEMFWKWVDDFYEIKRKVIHSGSIPHLLFCSNPNFQVSHTLLGMKLFIYSIYHTLFELKLISPIHFDQYTPPDFKWIHPEEILLFFWTEKSLLEKLKLFISRAQTETNDKELFAEISLLSDLFLSIYERYFLHPDGKGVKFIPAKTSEIKEDALKIIEIIQFEKANHPHGRLHFCIPNDLEEALTHRIS